MKLKERSRKAEKSTGEKGTRAVDTQQTFYLGEKNTGGRRKRCQLALKHTQITEEQEGE